jgi:hypothetical protein
MGVVQVRKLAGLVAVVMAFGAISVQRSMAAACSDAVLTGTYGLLVTGYDSSGLYQHGVAQIKSNGKGTLTGTETVSDDGTIFNKVAVTGTYTIGANCTGSGTIINPKNGNQTHYNFVVDPIANQVEAAGTDSGHGTASGVAIGLGTATCSLAGLNGTFGFHGGGDIPAQGQWALAGQFAFSGTGKLTGTETSVVAGTVTSAATLTGTYTMASNCMGTLTYKVGTLTRKWNIVMTNGGQGFVAIDTVSGFVGTVTAHE